MSSSDYKKVSKDRVFGSLSLDSDSWYRLSFRTIGTLYLLLVSDDSNPKPYFLIFAFLHEETIVLNNTP